MAPAEIIRYGNSGILGPPTHPPPPPLNPEEAETARQNAIRLSQALAVAGRAHWMRAHQVKHWTAGQFKAWRDEIPNFGCACKQHADMYIAAHKPPIEDDQGMRLWFVKFHDEVNLKLGKPKFGVEAARSLYGWD